MGILDNFEKGLERAVNGAFAKTFRSGLQPVEIGSALKRELDTKAAIVSRDRILVPNSFDVRLAPADFQRMAALGPTLIDDLTGIVQKHSADQGFQFAGGLSVGLVEDPKLSTGVLEIDSSTIQRDVTWVPVLDVAGKRHPLSTGATVIGRGREADITVEDTGISRKHLEILWDGKNAEARDLNSTNGSQLNGQPLTRSILTPDSVIQIGRTRVVFRVLAQSAAPAPKSAAPAAAPSLFSEPGNPAAAPVFPPHAAAPASEPAPAPAPAPAERMPAPDPFEQHPAPPQPAASEAPAQQPSPSAQPADPAEQPPATRRRAKPAPERRTPKAAPAKPDISETPDEKKPPEPGGFRWNL